MKLQTDITESNYEIDKILKVAKARDRKYENEYLIRANKLSQSTYETSEVRAHKRNKNPSQRSQDRQPCSLESQEPEAAEADEFIETFSDIDYLSHVKHAKEATRIFKKTSVKNMKILRPIIDEYQTSSSQYEETCIYYKCLF